MTIRFKDYGTHLGTRFKGACVRVQIIEQFNRCGRVEFDFAEVEAVSSSFADECFAKLIFTYEWDKINHGTTFKNTSPYIRTIINNAYQERRRTRTHESVNRSLLVF
ncbi:uncharacterized protein DUF4325 [Mucilaginibacter oryzae]|uniref:Uncharacterized protein DUF4325 n=2 Tax=Mucilaginibacter oryzae TaxID=468058 RepID=A0A316HXI0_9SPHI|nr:uncharacterized protein DUF4325 [Mucilaginibacter oryzae]